MQTELCARVVLNEFSYYGLPGEISIRPFRNFLRARKRRETPKRRVRLTYASATIVCGGGRPFTARTTSFEHGIILYYFYTWETRGPFTKDRRRHVLGPLHAQGVTCTFRSAVTGPGASVITTNFFFLPVLCRTHNIVKRVHRRRRACTLTCYFLPRSLCAHVRAMYCPPQPHLCELRISRAPLKYARACLIHVVART